jgi:hypothetical protein
MEFATMDWEEVTCPVCDAKAKAGPPFGDSSPYRCGTCGRFNIVRWAENDWKNRQPKQAIRLAALARAKVRAGIAGVPMIGTGDYF